ncbi:MAG: DUF973 family protein [Crenarchaeota archaeon]|nr:DUF973 family protein [Thermoproteota archaeon]
MFTSQLLIEGLKKIKIAALLYIIASILIGSSIILMIEFFITQIINLFFALIAVGATGEALSAASFIAFLVPGFLRIRKYDEQRFKTPAKLVLIGLGGSIILFAIFLILVGYSLIAFSSYAYPSAGLIGLGIAMSVTFYSSIVLLIIGYIGIIIGMFKLKDITGENLFHTAGILFIIGIFIPVLSFIAWILVFIGARRSIKRMQSLGYPPGGQYPATGSPTVMVPRQ